MVRTLVQMTALILTLEAAIFLARGNLGLSAQVIAELSSTKWGYNLDVAKSLAGQRADTWIGLVLILIAFILQLVNSLWPMRWMDFSVSKSGVVISVIVSGLAFLLFSLLARKVSSKTFDQVQAILRVWGQPNYEQFF